MIANTIEIEGTLQADGRLILDEKPALPPGRVRVSLQAIIEGQSKAERLPDVTWLDDAIDAFNRVIEDKGSRADGALYWRAYAENKLGKRTEAQATIAELKKTYPNSHWLDDAKALEVEVGQQSGQPRLEPLLSVQRRQPAGIRQSKQSPDANHRERRSAF